MKIMKKSRNHLFKIDLNDQKRVDLFYIVRVMNRFIIFESNAKC